MTRHCLEMVEIGAFWLHLVKESMKEKKIQQKSAKMTEIREITKKKTYLGSKQCVLTCYLGLETLEVGASSLRLVKESTKEKKKLVKISKNPKKPNKIKYPRPKRRVLTSRLVLKMMEVGASCLCLVKGLTKQKKPTKTSQNERSSRNNHKRDIP